jgi:hypothetical protein
MNDQHQSSGARKLQGSIHAPLVGNLAGAVTEAPALMDALATEFAPTAAKLATQQSYWIAINGWITDRLSGPIMDGEVGVESIKEHA